MRIVWYGSDQSVRADSNTVIQYPVDVCRNCLDMPSAFYPQTVIVLGAKLWVVLMPSWDGWVFLFMEHMDGARSGYMEYLFTPY